MATSNQLRFWELQEMKRSNLAKEGETARSNQAKEAETNRSNLANESIANFNALETQRSNIAKETETNRANVAKETENHRSNVARETETYRSNRQNEKLKAGDLALKRTDKMLSVVGNPLTASYAPFVAKAMQRGAMDIEESQKPEASIPNDAFETFFDKTVDAKSFIKDSISSAFDPARRADKAKSALKEAGNVMSDAVKGAGKLAKGDLSGVKDVAKTIGKVLDPKTSWDIYHKWLGGK